MSNTAKFVTFNETFESLAAKITSGAISRVSIIIASISDMPVMTAVFGRESRLAIMQACLQIGLTYLSSISNMTPEETGKFVTERVAHNRKQMAELEAMDEKDLNVMISEMSRVASELDRSDLTDGEMDLLEQIIDGGKVRTARSTSDGSPIIISPSDGRIH